MNRSTHTIAPPATAPERDRDSAGRGYTDLPVGERAAFELVCARHGFAPAHFEVEVAGHAPPAGEQVVTIRRGGWAQAYRIDGAGQWLRQFESDLNSRFFR